MANVGEQDITAHVNFTALQRTGETGWFLNRQFDFSIKFLTLIAERTWKNPERFEKWTSSRVQQFQTLTHPEHLGRPFRVLIQSR